MELPQVSFGVVVGVGVSVGVGVGVGECRSVWPYYTSMCYP